MRTIALILCLGACGGGEDEPPPVTGETLQVTIKWSWVRALISTCDDPVVSCTACNASCTGACGGLEQCCTDSKVIYASGRNRVFADYTRCDISNPTDELLVVDCPLDGTTPVYYTDENGATLKAGMPYEHTNASCNWSAPYPGP